MCHWGVIFHCTETRKHFNWETQLSTLGSRMPSNVFSYYWSARSVLDIDSSLGGRRNLKNRSKEDDDRCDADKCKCHFLKSSKAVPKICHRYLVSLNRGQIQWSSWIDAGKSYLHWGWCGNDAGGHRCCAAVWHSASLGTFSRSKFKVSIEGKRMKTQAVFLLHCQVYSHSYW